MVEPFVPWSRSSTVGMKAFLNFYIYSPNPEVKSVWHVVIINGKCNVLTFMFINIVYVLFRFPAFSVVYFCKVIFSLALVAHLSLCGALWITAYVISILISVALSIIVIVSVRFTFCVPVSMLSLFSFQCNSVNSVCGRFSWPHDMSTICHLHCHPWLLVQFLTCVPS